MLEQLFQPQITKKRLNYVANIKLHKLERVFSIGSLMVDIFVLMLHHSYRTIGEVTLQKEGATVSIILHSDLNCFYASVEMNEAPELKGKKVAVCGSTENRHGIVLTASYPAYPEQGWRVRVRPDATLTDLDTGRTLYCLFWEGRREEIRRPDSGFIVAGADTAAFLEEKLALLGLNARETEEFILYWLPAMQRNPWNYIRFAGEEEIGRAMPLAIFPAPDRVLRVWMEYTALAERPEGIPEQVLEPVSREELSASGFYAVEWGGSEF